MSVTFNPYPGQQIPLSEEKAELIKTGLTEAVKTCLPLYQEARRREAEADKKIALGKAMQESAQAKMALAQAKIASGQAKIASAQEKMSLAQEKIAEGQAKLKAAKSEEKNLIARIFYATFYGTKPLPVEEVDTLFSTYLSNNAISLISSGADRGGPKMNSMYPFVKYLEDHKGLKMCNLKHFKNNITGVEILADYVKKPSCSVTIIGINRSAKSILDEAVETRKGGLKVQYFD